MTLTAKMITKKWDISTDEEIQNYFSREQIKWNFIVQHAPWHGGFYERMVGLIKQSYKQTIGRQILRWDEAITLLNEIEAIINSRPLTYVHNDINDI